MKNIETIFDNELSQIHHYIKFPSLMPFVGKSYIKASKKILFLGESHYLPNNSNINLNPQDWYSLKTYNH